MFTWVLQRLADATLVVGRTVGIDATTLEANATMRSIVRWDTGESYDAFLTRLAEASGLTTPTRAELARFDRTRRKKGSNDDWTHPRRLNRQQVLTLGACAWVAERHNLIVIGPTGIGKSFLCCAFVERACRRGFSARYVRMPRLLYEVAVGRGDGSYARLLTRLAKLDLLAIDDWMIAPLRDAERRDLTEVIEDRAERATTLTASQLPVTDWHAVIGDANQADAICDGLLDDAHRIELQGRSMRRTHRAPKTRTRETR